MAALETAAGPGGLLNTLPTRPPTPPKESAKQGHLKHLPSPTSATLGSPQATVHTPLTISPPSSAEPGSQSSLTRRKTVNFSAWTTHHHAPTPSHFRKDDVENQLKPLPPSRERMSARSILKPHGGLQTLPITPSSPLADAGNRRSQHGSDFPALLESLVQQLAGEVRTSRIDAYVSLAATLKAYDGVPSPTAIKDKLGLLTQFLRRDITITVPETGAPDFVLVSSALKLLMIFIWTPEISLGFADDFKAFLVEHSISAIGAPHMPKILANLYMQLFCLQKFGSKALTTDRLNRLVTVLTNVEERVTGSGVIAERLVVLQRLLGQARHVMISRVGDWLDHLFSGMLSSVKEVRSRALAFGIDAGIALGTVAPISRHVQALFRRETEQGKFSDYLVQRLGKMIEKKEDGQYVPQIWSVVILLLRSRANQLETWEYMKPWLLVVQKCFNSGELVNKFQANVAWGRLIFALNLDESTSPTMVRMMRQPIIKQLERKAKDKCTIQSRKFAMNSLCTLLYYSLRPSANAQQLDRYWDEYVHPTIAQALLANSLEVDFACQVLISLLDGSIPRAWSENRANESGPIKPDELPRLDPKWVRSRAKKILQTIEVALQSSHAWTRGFDGHSRIRELWDCFTKTVAEAGNKEIKVSPELAETVANILSFFEGLWKAENGAAGLSSEKHHEGGLGSINSLVKAIVKNLGPLCFTETMLLRNDEGSYTVANASDKSGAKVARTPALYLLQLLADWDPEKVTSRYRLDGLRDVLSTFLSSRTSRNLQIRYLLDSALHLQRTGDLSWVLWSALASCAESTANIKIRGSDEDPGDFRKEDIQLLTEMLALGYAFDQEGSRSFWEALLETTTTAAKWTVGDRVAAALVIEPLAAAVRTRLLETQDLALLRHGSLLLGSAKYPSLDSTTRTGRQGGKSWLGHGQPPPDVAFFRELFQMIEVTMQMSYASLTTIEANVPSFLNVLSMFISRCPTPYVIPTMERLRDVLSIWIEDADGLLSGQAAAVIRARQETMNLWTTVREALSRLHPDSAMLASIEPIVAAALQSRRRVIVNDAIKMWNSTFGTAQSLDYPPKVRTAMQRLRRTVDLRLPGFPEDDQDQVPAPLVFSSSQDSIESEERKDTPTTRKFSRSPLTRSGRRSHESKSQPSTPARKVIKSPKTAGSVPRLRHNDSQIEFMAIETSSPPRAADLESQILTAHQREVKERQQAEAAAMFPDVRSTPSSRSRESKKANLPPLTLTSDLPTSEPIVIDGPSTPTLVPPSHGPMDDFIASSPTPRRGSREMIYRVGGADSHSMSLPASSEVVVDPPSSPPQAGAEGSADQQTSPTDPASEAASEAAPQEMNIDVPLEDTPRDDVSSAQASSGAALNPDTPDEDVEMSDDRVTALTEEATSPEESWDMGNDGQGMPSSVLPDEIPGTPDLEHAPRAERYVDAPSSPHDEAVDRAVFHDALQSPVAAFHNQQPSEATSGPEASPKSRTLMTKIMSPLKDNRGRLSLWTGFGSLHRKLSQSRPNSHPSTPMNNDAPSEQLILESASQFLPISYTPQKRKRKAAAEPEERVGKKAKRQRRQSEDGQVPATETLDNAADTERADVQSSGGQSSQLAAAPLLPRHISDPSPVASRTRRRRRDSIHSPPTEVEDAQRASPKRRCTTSDSANVDATEEAPAQPEESQTITVFPYAELTQSPTPSASVTRRSARLSHRRESASRHVSDVAELIEAFSQCEPEHEGGEETIAGPREGSIHKPQLKDKVEAANVDALEKDATAPPAAEEDEPEDPNVSAEASKESMMESSTRSTPSVSPPSEDEETLTPAIHDAQIHAHGLPDQISPEHDTDQHEDSHATASSDVTPRNEEDPSAGRNVVDEPTTPRRILNGLQNIFRSVQSLGSDVLKTAEVREMDDALFEIRREIFRAEEDRRALESDTNRSHSVDVSSSDAGR